MPKNRYVHGIPKNRVAKRATFPFSNHYTLHRRTILLNTLFLSLGISLFSQKNDSVQQLPKKYLSAVSSKAEQLDQKLDKQSAKALQQMQKLEEKINQKLSKTNPAKAAELAGNAEQQYKKLEDKLSGKASSLKQYIPNLDTALTSLKFLDQNSQLLSNVKDGKQQLQNAIGKVQGLKEQFQKAEEVRRFLKERKEYLRQQLENTGFAKELKALSKKSFYFEQQLQEYRALLKDHKKVERKALELLSRSSLYKNFLSKNSELASLFRLPGNPTDPLSQANVAGLQTRSQVNSYIQQQISSGGPNAMAQIQQNLQQAQNEINQLKNKILQSGQGSSDAEMPEGFSPNNEKGRPLLKRLDISVNLQSQKSASFLPVSTDVALQIGYRFRQNIITGVGFGGRMGWGHSIKNIRITYSGISIRSYAELKLKKSFWAYIGYEQNYRPEIRDIELLKDHSLWSVSGLAGVSKQMPVRSRFFKKTKLMLLWDFLSYRQNPRVSQPLVFRIGYNIK